jgi:hypothetical protein
MHAPSLLMAQLGTAEAGPGNMLQGAVQIQLTENY